MKKIAQWLLEKAKKGMRTDPFTTPSRRTKLSYYFDNLVSMVFYIMGIYIHQGAFNNHCFFIELGFVALTFLVEIPFVTLQILCCNEHGD